MDSYCQHGISKSRYCSDCRAAKAEDLRVTLDYEIAAHAKTSADLARLRAENERLRVVLDIAHRHLDAFGLIDEPGVNAPFHAQIDSQKRFFAAYRALAPSEAAGAPKQKLRGIVCEKPGCNETAIDQCGEEKWALCAKHTTNKEPRYE